MKEDPIHIQKLIQRVRDRGGEATAEEFQIYLDYCIEEIDKCCSYSPLLQELIKIGQESMRKCCKEMEELNERLRRNETMQS